MVTHWIVTSTIGFMSAFTLNAQDEKPAQQGATVKKSEQKQADGKSAAGSAESKKAETKKQASPKDLWEKLPAAERDRRDTFFAAVRKGDRDTVTKMLDAGLDVNIQTRYGATALHFAADRGDVEMTKLLLARKANPKQTDSFYMATPIVWAQMNSREDVQLLLMGDDASAIEAALQSAASGGKEKTVETILEKFKDKISAQALGKSLIATSSDVIRKKLLEAGAKEPDLKEFKVDAKVLAEYAGKYSNPEIADAIVSVAKTRLQFEFGGRKSIYYATSEKVFKSLEDDAVTITFARDKSNKVSDLTLARTLLGATLGSFKLTRADSATAKPTTSEPASKQTIAKAVKETRPKVAKPLDWLGFRGPGATGIADGQKPPVTWNLKEKINVGWTTKVDGLGHSCPVIVGNKVFITTAISGDPKAGLRAGQYGDVESVDDTTEHRFKVLCFNFETGQLIWEKEVVKGVPKVKRHLKGTHANPTIATDGKTIVASFGSEGMFAFTVDGSPKWQVDLGKLDSGWFFNPDYQWGFGSSPTIDENRVIVQCDVGKGSYLAAWSLDSGKELWKTERDEVPSWGSPTVIAGPEGKEIVTNGTNAVRGYDAKTGKELWQLRGNSEITVPTPFEAGGMVFVTAGYRPIQPIYAIKLGNRGDLTSAITKPNSKVLAWNKKAGGPYMPTPIAYGDHFYTLDNSGVLTCFELKSGKQIYKQRVPGRGGYTASPIAADGHIYCASEQGGVSVVRAGPKYELVATNPLDDICMATPAISNGTLIVRTANNLIALRGE